MCTKFPYNCPGRSRFMNLINPPWCTNSIVLPPPFSSEEEEGGGRTIFSLHQVPLQLSRQIALHEPDQPQRGRRV